MSHIISVFTSAFQAGTLKPTCMGVDGGAPKARSSCYCAPSVNNGQMCAASSMKYFETPLNMNRPIAILELKV